jgi:hypothetical protein
MLPFKNKLLLVVAVTYMEHVSRSKEDTATRATVEILDGAHLKTQPMDKEEAAFTCWRNCCCPILKHYYSRREMPNVERVYCCKTGFSQWLAYLPQLKNLWERDYL